MVAGLQMFWTTCRDRNRELCRKDDVPGISIDVQSQHNETVDTIKIEIDRINKKVDDFQSETIETLRKDTDKRFDEMERKFESLQNKFHEGSLSFKRE